jgi:hypothetical protein
MADTWVERFNKVHAPAGSATGGQFAAASGSSGGKDAKGKDTRPTPSNQHPVGKGETGKRVSDLQARLNALGANLKVDGIFGPKTLAAVKAFQRSHGLVVDGLVGPKTTAALRGGKKAAQHAPAKTAAHAPAKAPAKAATAQKPRGTEPAGTDRADAKKPYGDVTYADPGYLDADGNQASKSGKPGVKRYPLSPDKVVAAWSYINQAKNAGQYTAEQLSAIKGRIKAAMAKHGHKVSEAKSADPDGQDRASDLKYGHGSQLWKYWTRGEGFAKWSAAVHKWTTLRDLLLKAGVPPTAADGLTTNIIQAVMPGYMKQAHAKGRSAVTHAPDLDVVRSGAGMKLEPAEDGTLGTLTGRFSEFGRWYRVSSKMEGDFLERVAPGATAGTIRDNKDSMRVLFDHGMDAQIGNKVLGPIDVLDERSDGPWYEVPLFDTSYNRDLLPGLKAGVYGASMRMRVTGDEWDDHPERSDGNPDGLPERTITAMKVFEFGPVTFPANPGASAGVRSATDEFYHRLRQADTPAFEDAMRAAGLPLPEDFTGRDGARSAPGGDGTDVQPGNGGPSTPTTSRAALRDRAWRMRRQLHA